jgi:hypothetical protein
VFRGTGRLGIRDIFGLTSNRFGSDMGREFVVRPFSQSDMERPSIVALDGMENKSKHRSSEVERYFMREYIPGDRFRDINWKASSRLNELFTRISPVTQEKTRLIEVHFRHFSTQKRETVESVIHLNFLKSWVLAFMRAVKQEHPEFQFRVTTGRGAADVESEEQMNLLAQEVSGLFFQAPVDLKQAAGPLFIFTTPFDRRLVSQPGDFQAATMIFRTATPSGKQLSSGKPHVRRSRIALARFFSSTFLPGRWIAARSGSMTNPRFGANGSQVYEEVLEVGLVSEK